MIKIFNSIAPESVDLVTCEELRLNDIINLYFRSFSAGFVRPPLSLVRASSALQSGRREGLEAIQ